MKDWLAAPLARAAVLQALAAAAVIALVTSGWQPLLRLDQDVAARLHALALEHPGWTHAHRILTDWVVDPWTMRLLLTVTVFGLWWQRRRLLALCLALTSIAETALRALLRWAIGRERPHWQDPVDTANFAALPSGHAMTTAATCVLLLGLARQIPLRPWLWHTARVAAILIIAVACFTRIFLGVHWLTDTLAGVLLGSALATAAFATWHSLTGPDRAARTAKPALPRQHRGQHREATSDTDN
ncbi:phosphatase PAP2 family protein [Streptomyces cyaneofuscatus]|uniref:phosphatase PAP2 family protein n=1 Tax=Streptomyces cyaneofuscatus TaxID=66883 RepID=UPI003CF63097